jgi:hypothetical protein
MKINSENIDELMFQLLEGDIQGEERTHLLEAIATDKEYSALWQAWQQTVLNPNDELIVMPLAPMLKKKKVVLWSWKYGVAAMLCLTIGASVFYINHSAKEDNLVANQKPRNPKLEIIKVPTNEPVSNRLKEKDTVVSFKQKIESIAKKGNETKTKRLIPPPRRAPVQNVGEQLVQNIRPIMNAPIKNDRVEKKVAIAEVVTGNLPTDTDNSNILVSVQTQSKPRIKTTEIKQILSEKKSFLSRVFSRPSFQILNDSNSILDSKILIENKKYKIIAGF